MARDLHPVHIAVFQNPTESFVTTLSSIENRLSASSNISSFYSFSSQLSRLLSFTMSGPDGVDLTVPSLFNFSSHICLVTGGATGLGEMAAQAFVQNGAHVIIASRKESELKKTSDRLNKLGPGKCEYVVADLKDKKGCDALVAEVKKRVDRLDVLINNSGATW